MIVWNLVNLNRRYEIRDGNRKLILCNSIDLENNFHISIMCVKSTFIYCSFLKKMKVMQIDSEIFFEGI